MSDNVIRCLFCHKVIKKKGINFATYCSRCWRLVQGKLRLLG
jgi:hypothetical protein